ncbi:MAG: ankyrin repeat domain-containing protein [Gemmatimonadota bacterium]|nr:ankyrin repeat domain-containing protein [Gemmatimonadota bacterium]
MLRNLIITAGRNLVRHKAYALLNVVGLTSNSHKRAKRIDLMLPFIACLIGLVLSIRVGAEPLVEGRIRLSSGLPAAGVQVQLFDLSDLRQSVGTTTDATGYFALSLQTLSRGRNTALPADFALGQNYPNPFNPSTLIPYQLPAAAHVRLEVFNMLGQRLIRLVNGERSAGVHTARWDGTDAAGRAVGAGVYIYRLSSGGMEASRRMVLIDGQAGVRSGVSSRPPRLAPATQDQAYGLVVWGSDMVAYVDPAFHIRDGMAPVDIVVEERSLSGRLKVVESGLLGDVNGDGRVDIVDALFVAMYSVDPSTLAAHIPNISLGDVDADGDIDFADAYLIGTYSVNPLDPALPAGIGQAVSDPEFLTPEAARSVLDERGIAYTPASFFERVRAGDVSAVRLFIAAGMDIHVRDDDGTTALNVAALEGHVEVVRILVEQWIAEAGAQTQDADGRTVLMWAASGGDVEMVRLLLENGANIHAQDADSTTVLMWAASGGGMEVVHLLLENGAYINAQDKYGYTALTWAAGAGQVEVVRLLLTNGADVHAQNNSGITALMLAARAGQVEVVRLLLDNGADINAQDDLFDRTVLMWAARGGDVEVVRLLLDNGADLHAQDDLHGRTALAWAAFGGHVEVVRFLLENGTDINAQNVSGRTALMYATLEGDVEVVRFLLDNGADLHAQDAYYGRTALAWAAWGGDVEVVRLLLDNGADIHMRTNEGTTALVLAVLEGHVEVARILVEQWVAEGDVDARYDDDTTILMWAARAGHVEMVRFLLENGTDIHARNNNGTTALAWAAWGGDVEVVRFLLENGADIHTRNNSDWTVLMWAARGGDVEVVRLLLENGTDIHARNNDGTTALSLAKNSGRQEVIDLLEAAGATE